MLKFLHIENIAVIERSDIEFADGFTVLTGETGAGKSILIDAINAVLGERASKDLIRSGCNDANVTALFGNFNKTALSKLRELDIEPDQDGNILISRRLSIKGSGIIKINGKPSTASILKDISSNLINIHGQHDNQALLNPDMHCGFIDEIARNSDIIHEYYEEFRNLNKIRKELTSLECDLDEKQRKIDLLKYQINELENADIKIGEIVQLKQKLKIAEDFQKNLKSITISRDILSGNEDIDGVISMLKDISKELSAINIENFDSHSVKINEIIASLLDINADLNLLLDSDDMSNINIDDINNRLDLLYRIMLKYGGSEEAALKFLETAKTDLNNIVLSDKKINQLSIKLDESKNRLISLGDKLSTSRVNAAKNFESQVCEVLKYLNMPDVKFVVEFNKGRYTKTGCDIVEFKISANVGETVKPLAKIASGGELSRVMLAIKSVLSSCDYIDTLIFDEIDAGISGFAADKVALQLKKVSNYRQVICITHLAQIAAKADNHLLIEKNTDNQKTFTEVSVLSPEGRIKEIARIMSGTVITENLYSSAKELLDRSNFNANL